MTITEHAARRMQSRSVPKLVIDWLLDFGSTQHDKRGAVIYFFDRTAKRKLEKEVGRQVVRRMSEFLNAYVVCDHETIITTGWRTRRVHRA